MSMNNSDDIQEDKIIPATIYASDKLIRSLEAEFSEEKDDIKKRRLRFICDLSYAIDSELRHFYWG